MVATVLRLRYRVLGNTLARRPWQLVGFCFGVAWALGILAMLAAGLAATGAASDTALSRVVAVLGGSALVLGWVVAPLIVAGVDTTVDAAKLAPFPLRTRQIMAILTATGLTGVPGIVSALAALLTVLLWVHWPVAAVAAVPCAVLGVLTCVVATRLATSLTQGLGEGRRGREAIGTIVLILVMLAGPLLTGILALLSSAGDIAAQLQRAAGLLGWTPLGAAWSVPADLAAGAVGVAALKLMIAAVTLAGLWLLWSRALVRASVSSPRTSARTVRPGALGLFGRMPTGGLGATWARALTGWLRDPRYLRQLIVVPLIPLLFAFFGGTANPLFAGSAVVVALTLCIAGYADVSYDGTAFASVLSTGIRGRDDRWGRALGAACVGVPLTVLVAVVTALIAGRADLLPAILGASLGLLLAGYAVSAVSSALIVSPVAAPGDSPFKTVPGQTFLNSLLVFVVLGASVLLAAPALILAIVASTTADVVLGWVALAVGVGVGAGATIGGVIVGGRTLERTGPDLLQRIKAFPVG